MYAKLYGATLHGIDGCIITVEVDISQGLPVFDIVGLPNQSVKEARERRYLQGLSSVWIVAGL